MTSWGGGHRATQEKRDIHSDSPRAGVLTVGNELHADDGRNHGRVCVGANDKAGDVAVAHEGCRPRVGDENGGGFELLKERGHELGDVLAGAEERHGGGDGRGVDGVEAEQAERAGGWVGRGEG